MCRSISAVLQGEEAVGGDRADEPVLALHSHLGDRVHGMFHALLNSHDGMFQALLNSQGYFCLFTPHSLTSQAANDLFIVGNVPRTKVSI